LSPPADKTTKPATFRTLAYQITQLLAIEATRDWRPRNATSNAGRAGQGRVLSHEPIVVAAILRAGVVMVQPFLDMFPMSARLRGPRAGPQDGDCPQLLLEVAAAGVVACLRWIQCWRRAVGVAALTVLKQNGAVKPTLVCIVAAPEESRS